jgi:putative FmdB family regulatory protein
MALYEYLCRDCDTSFEVKRTMGEPDGVVACPSGHTDVRRRFSMFASVGAPVGAGAAQPVPASSGGCCGGACGCGH